MGAIKQLWTELEHLREPTREDYGMPALPAGDASESRVTTRPSVIPAIAHAHGPMWRVVRAMVEAESALATAERQAVETEQECAAVLQRESPMLGYIPDGVAREAAERVARAANRDLIAEHWPALRWRLGPDAAGKLRVEHAQTAKLRAAAAVSDARQQLARAEAAVVDGLRAAQLLNGEGLARIAALVAPAAPEAEPVALESDTAEAFWPAEPALAA